MTTKGCARGIEGYSETSHVNTPNKNITVSPSKKGTFRFIIVDFVALFEAMLIATIAVLLKVVYVDSFYDNHSTTVYANVGIAGAFICCAVMKWLGHYHPDKIVRQKYIAISILQAYAISFLLLLALAFLFRVTSQYARGWVILWFALSYLAVVCARGLTVVVLRKLAKQGRFNKHVAIIGDEHACNQLREYIKRYSPETELAGVFCFPQECAAGEATPSDFGAQLRELADFGRTHQIDQIVAALPSYDKKIVQEILLELSPLAAHIDVFPGVILPGPKSPGISYIGDLGLYNLQRRPIGEWGVVAKRALDLAFVIPALIILALPMLVIAALVRLTSRGSALFIQERHGVNNTVIRVMKFRTMFVRPRAGDHQVKLGDPEITWIGRFLRRNSLDELPQLLNVLRGEMSLVGPRPHAVMMNQKFAHVVRHDKKLERFDRYAARHKVKPGITGWAQVNNFRGETDTPVKIEMRIEYDLEYIDEWSLWFDLKIIFMTFGVLVDGENAH